MKQLKKVLLFVLVFLVSLTGSFYLVSFTSLPEWGRWLVSISVAILVTMAVILTRKMDKEEQEAEHFKEPHR